jgi:hypothetical protein
MRGGNKKWMQHSDDIKVDLREMGSEVVKWIELPQGSIDLQISMC